jgi:hypothetical protein
MPKLATPKRLIILALMFFIALMTEGYCQNWQFFPALYYQNSSAVIRAEYINYEKSGTAYRFQLDIADEISGTIGTGTLIGTTPFENGEPITADSSGYTAICDSVVGTTMYVHDVSGKFITGTASDTLVGDSSGAKIRPLTLYLDATMDATIYIPAFNAMNISASYSAGNLDLDSIYVNCIYGTSWGYASDMTFFEIETLQDSLIYWYGNDVVHEISVTPGYFPAPYVVFDFYSINTAEYSGVLDFYIYIQRQGY